MGKISGSEEKFEIEVEHVIKPKIKSMKIGANPASQTWKMISRQEELDKNSGIDVSFSDHGSKMKIKAYIEAEFQRETANIKVNNLEHEKRKQIQKQKEKNENLALILKEMLTRKKTISEITDDEQVELSEEDHQMWIEQIMQIMEWIAKPESPRKAQSIYSLHSLKNNIVKNELNESATEIEHSRELEYHFKMHDIFIKSITIGIFKILLPKDNDLESLAILEKKIKFLVETIWELNCSIELKNMQLIEDLIGKLHPMLKEWMTQNLADVPDERIDLGLNSCAFPGHVLLRGAPVTLINGDKEVDVLAFFDEGANSTMLDQTVANQLKLNGKKYIRRLDYSDGTTKAVEAQNVSIQIRARNGHKVFWMTNVKTATGIAFKAQTSLTEEIIQKWDHLQDLEIDPRNFNEKFKILIGQDQAPLIIPRIVREGPIGAPLASFCHLGWSIHGKFFGVTNGEAMAIGVTPQSDDKASLGTQCGRDDPGSRSKILRFGTVWKNPLGIWRNPIVGSNEKSESHGDKISEEEKQDVKTAWMEVNFFSFINIL